MDTITSYLENMFAALPKNGQMLKLKQDLLLTMEEKYQELKLEGKTENEAVGIVISEFGNIDELIEELGIAAVPHEPQLPVVTEEEAASFVEAKKRAGLLNGIGVYMCLFGAALLILFSALTDEGLLGLGSSEDTGYMLGLIAMFILVVPAIGIFIYSSTKMERYKYLEGEFVLPVSLRILTERQQAAFAPVYTRSLIGGVCLAVLSPVAIFIATAIGDDASTYGVSVMLPILGIAIFLFIYYGAIRESYNMLLQKEDFSKDKKEENRIIGAVAAIVWPLATCIFLFTGFVFNQWHINWVVFPLTGILFGTFCGAYNILRKEKHS